MTAAPDPRHPAASPPQDRLPQLRGTLTHENLKAAFASEAQAARLYAYFARVAEIEGYLDAARTLRELAESQALVADGHVDFLKRAGDPLTGLAIGETPANLRVVLAAEAHDSAESLPRMVQTAHAEGFADIASWFETLAKAKRAHAVRAQKALENARQDSE